MLNDSFGRSSSSNRPNKPDFANLGGGNQFGGAGQDFSNLGGGGQDFSGGGGQDVGQDFAGGGGGGGGQDGQQFGGMNPMQQFGGQQQRMGGQRGGGPLGSPNNPLQFGFNGQGGLPFGGGGGGGQQQQQPFQFGGFGPFGNFGNLAQGSGQQPMQQANPLAQLLGGALGPLAAGGQQAAPLGGAMLNPLAGGLNPLGQLLGAGGPQQGGAGGLPFGGLGNLFGRR